MNSQQIKKLKELLSTPKNIIITAHKNPDGDAMGSALAMSNYLILKGHKTTVLVPNEIPDFLHWLPGNNKVLIYEEHQKKCKDVFKKADVIFCLDFNNLKRIDELGDLVRVSSAVKVLIDHHQQPEDFAQFVFSDTNYDSTSHLIYDFIELLGDKNLINKSIANCLYTGIMTDTGSFRFPSTTAKTHLVTAALINAGAENAKVYDLIYDNNKENKIRLLGYCLSEKMKVLEEFDTAFISLTKEELSKYDYKSGDTEGVVNYALSLEGIKFAAFFSETEDEIRISFRSKGKFSVNNFARLHFNGGGHTNAAGGNADASMDETISKFISLLPQYRSELLDS